MSAGRLFTAATRHVRHFVFVFHKFVFRVSHKFVFSFDNSAQKALTLGYGYILKVAFLLALSIYRCLQKSSYSN